MLMHIALLAVLLNWGGPKFHRLLSNAAAQQELGITAEQMDRIIEIQDKYETQMIDLQTQIRKNMVELRALWRDPNANQKRIEELIRRNGELRTELSILKMHKWLEIWNVLTKEQQEKLWRMARMGWHWPFGGLPGGPHGSGPYRSAPPPEGE
ncbi:MAG: hypothetical protein DRQ10_05570 [Candidatus Hydrothermota bacterium]|nr:MAG: hypothetical protein DRQ10_05570 [Candidatus Hydrothermae bacterium]